MSADWQHGTFALFFFCDKKTAVALTTLGQINLKLTNVFCTSDFLLIIFLAYSVGNGSRIFVFCEAIISHTLFCFCKTHVKIP